MPDQEPLYPSGLPALFEVVRRLRAPDGCPWDKEQTHLSLRPYLLEETYEVLEALDAADDAKLKEELGDLLLQVAMHAEIAAQEGRFDAAQISETAAAKMVARHPHVFGDTSVADAEHVLRNWERQKAAEAEAAGRSSESALDRVPRSLPALAWVLGLQKRAARVGFEGAAGDPRERQHEERAAALLEGLTASARKGASSSGDDQLFSDLGDLLFSLVSLARVLRINPEDALRGAGSRFREGFNRGQLTRPESKSEGQAP